MPMPSFEDWDKPSLSFIFREISWKATTVNLKLLLRSLFFSSNTYFGDSDAGLRVEFLPDESRMQPNKGELHLERYDNSKVVLLENLFSN